RVVGVPVTPDHGTEFALILPVILVEGTEPACKVPLTSTLHRSLLPAAFSKCMRLPVGELSVARFPNTASLPLLAWLITGLLNVTVPVKLLLPLKVSLPAKVWFWLRTLLLA